MVADETRNRIQINPKHLFKNFRLYAASRNEHATDPLGKSISLLFARSTAGAGTSGQVLVSRSVSVIAVDTGAD